MSTNSYRHPQENRTFAILAWIVTILISTLPDILFDKLTNGVPPWLTFGKMGLLLGLIVVAFVSKSLRPLRNYFIVMFAFFGLFELRSLIDFTLPPLQTLFGSNIFDNRMQPEQTGKLAVSVVMIILLFALGYKRRDFFLTRGNLRAPIEPVPLLGFPKRDPWYKFGLQWGFYIAAALVVVQYISLRPGDSLLLKIIPLLPSILFYAALNAFNEEMVYRAPMLATLENECGSRHALWMSAYFFGIAHYFGTPGGILGGILSIFMSWILGKGMLETRGLFWTWWIHFLSDIAIFSFLCINFAKVIQRVIPLPGFERIKYY